MPSPVNYATMTGRNLFTIDASDLIKVSNDIAKVAAMTPRGLESALTRAANNRLRLISVLSPRQTRTDNRFAGHLQDSFGMYKSRGVRTIYTSEPDKLRWVSLGTAPHSFGPRYAKALWWPGIQGGRPVARVNHPGTRYPYPFVEIALEAFDLYGGPIINVSTMFRPSGGGGGGAGKPSRMGGAGAIASDQGILGALADGIVMGIMGAGGLLALAASVVANVAAAALEWAAED